MLAIVNFSRQRLVRFDFQPPEIPRGPEAHLHWVLADVPARRDALWDLKVDVAKLLLLKIFYEEQNKGDRTLLIPILCAFGTYGPVVPFARQLTHEFFADPDVAVRVAALQATGTFGASDSVPLLLSQLKSVEPAVHNAALVALAAMGDAAVFDKLLALTAGTPELEHAVIAGRDRRKALVAGDERRFVYLTLSSRLLYEDLCGLAPVLFRDIAGLVMDRTQPIELRLRAIRVLTAPRVRSKLITDVMLPCALDDIEPVDLRIACVRYLGRVRARGAVAGILRLLDSNQPALQDAAIAALGEIGDPQAIVPLLNHFDDRDGAIRTIVEQAAAASAETLSLDETRDWARGKTTLDPYVAYFFIQGRLETVPPRVALVGLLGDPHAEGRRQAALLLSVFGHPDDTDALRASARGDADELVRDVAARAAELCTARRLPQLP